MSGSKGGWRQATSQSDKRIGTADRSELDHPTCLRCGFTVAARPWGCKNPCSNCGFIYPIGDCSD